MYMDSLAASGRYRTILTKASTLAGCPRQRRDGHKRRLCFQGRRIVRRWRYQVRQKQKWVLATSVSTVDIKGKGMLV